MTVHSAATDPAELLSARRSEIKVAMAQYLTGTAGEPPSPDDKDAAIRLVDILIASLRDPEAAPAKNMEQPIERYYYGLFGDGLSPILRDVLGADADAALVSTVVDGYWRVVRTQRQ